jgi:hypothetical protein
MSIPSLNVSASNSDDEISDESPLQRGSGGEEQENISQVAFKIRLPSFLYHVLVRRIVRVALTMLRSLRLSIESRGQKLSTK